MVLSTLVELVEFRGYGCLSFDSGEVYLDYLDSPGFVAPIALLTDHYMPGINGIQLIQRVRERLPRLNAVIVSGSNGESSNSLIATHACYQLAKPYRPQALFSLLATLTSYHDLCEQGATMNPQKAAAVIDS